MAKDQARFKIVGAVSKHWINAKGNFGTCDIEVQDGKYKSIFRRCKAFSDVIDAFREIGIGEVIEVVGNLGNEKLTNKAREDVKVDGFNVWVNVLTITSIKRDGEVVRPTGPKKTAAPVEDDDIKF
jgi:hypothetical protein